MLKDALVVVTFLLGLFGAAMFLMTNSPAAQAVRGWAARAVMSGWLGWAVGAAVAVGVLSAVVFVVGRGRQARSAWAEFAARHGLRYERSRGLKEPLGRVSGERGGRRVELSAELVSDPSRRPDPEGASVLWVEVRRAPPGLLVSRRFELPRLAKALFREFAARSGASPDVTTGDEAFDRAFQVRGADAGAVRLWLDEDRRRVLSALLSQPNHSFSSDGLAWEDAGEAPSVALLTSELERLERAAAQLER